MPPINEVSCPACGKLIALFEKPDDPARLVGACDCIGYKRSVIEIDNPNFKTEADILEPAEPLPPTPTQPVEKRTTRRKTK